jgi:hypothetical protein
MLGAVRILFITLAILAIACRQSTAPPSPLVVTLEANTAVAQPGDTVTFTVNATANNLFGVVIDFGDANGDQFSTGGASTARVTFKHAYTLSGTYVVRATATDAIAGEKEASLTIGVN